MHKSLKIAFENFEIADKHLNDMLKEHVGGFNYNDNLYKLVIKMEENEEEFLEKEVEFLKSVKRMLERSSSNIENSMEEPHKFMAVRMCAKYEICKTSY